MSQTPSYSPALEQLVSGVQTEVRYGADITAAQAASPTCITSFTLNYPNSLEGVPCIGKAGTAAQGVVSKAQDITVDFEVSFKNKTYIDNFLNLETFALYISARNGVVVSATDTNSQQYGFNLLLPRLQIVTHTMASDNDAYYSEVITAKVLYDTSAGYDVRFQVFNGLA